MRHERLRNNLKKISDTGRSSQLDVSRWSRVCILRFLALSVMYIRIFGYCLSFIFRSVKTIKPLGCLAMIDDGELDWKVRAFPA